MQSRLKIRGLFLLVVAMAPFSARPLASDDDVPPELDGEAEAAVSICPEQAVIYFEEV